MNLKEYAEKFAQFVAEHPELADAIVVSNEADGYVYLEVEHMPTIGTYDSPNFVEDGQSGREGFAAKAVKAVCLYG